MSIQLFLKLSDKIDAVGQKHVHRRICVYISRNETNLLFKTIVYFGEFELSSLSDTATHSYLLFTKDIRVLWEWRLYLVSISGGQYWTTKSNQLFDIVSLVSKTRITHQRLYSIRGNTQRAFGSESTLNLLDRFLAILGLFTWTLILSIQAQFLCRLRLQTRRATHFSTNTLILMSWNNSFRTMDLHSIALILQDFAQHMAVGTVAARRTIRSQMARLNVLCRRSRMHFRPPTRTHYRT